MNKPAKPKVSLGEWFRLNLEIGALSFGGSGRLLLYQDAIVDKYHWMLEDEFREVLTIAQVFPGPNLVNISAYIGMQLVGRLAAFLGVLALALPGALIIVAIILLVSLENRHVSAIFQGFSLGSVTIFSIFVWKLFAGLSHSYRPGVKLRPAKFIMRLALAAGVGLASNSSVPLPYIILFGGMACALAEFLT